jgi:hypothetical protein
VGHVARPIWTVLIDKYFEKLPYAIVYTAYDAYVHLPIWTALNNVKYSLWIYFLINCYQNIHGLAIVSHIVKKAIVYKSIM